VAGDGRLQSLGEFWQAMGGKPKASLQYTVTVGLEIFDEEDLGVATSTHEVQMGAIAGSDSA
jgi:hypothetical protein